MIIPRTKFVKRMTEIFMKSIVTTITRTILFIKCRILKQIN